MLIFLDGGRTRHAIEGVFDAQLLGHVAARILAHQLVAGIHRQPAVLRHGREFGRDVNRNRLGQRVHALRNITIKRGGDRNRPGFAGRGQNEWLIFGDACAARLPARQILDQQGLGSIPRRIAGQCVSDVDAQGPVLDGFTQLIRNLDAARQPGAQHAVLGRTDRERRAGGGGRFGRRCQGLERVAGERRSGRPPGPNTTKVDPAGGSERVTVVAAGSADQTGAGMTLPVTGSNNAGAMPETRNLTSPLKGLPDWLESKKIKWSLVILPFIQCHQVCGRAVAGGLANDSSNVAAEAAAREAAVNNPRMVRMKAIPAMLWQSFADLSSALCPLVSGPLTPPPPQSPRTACASRGSSTC